MQTWVTGVKWKDPQNSTKMERKADVYVDDAALWTNGIEPTQDLKTKMKQDLIKYESMINWTGGDLRLHKCFFGIMEWEFTDSGKPQLQDRKHTLNIPMLAQDQKEVKKLQKAIKTSKYKINPAQQQQILTLTGWKITQDDEI